MGEDIQAGEVQEGQLLMTQAERDWLVVLKKAKKKLITQKQAAEEVGITESQPLSGNRVSAVGQHHACGYPGQRRRRSSSAGKAPRPGGDSQSCGRPPGE